MLSVPFCALAQSYARFSVEPSDPALRAGVGPPGTEFTFTADVTDARSYRIDFDDGTGPVVRIVQPGSDSRVVIPYTYDEAGRYLAKLTAVSAAGESIELQLNVRVEVPAPPSRPAEGYARFSVSPDEQGDWADFIFVADVSNAESYDIAFGDDAAARNVAPGANGRAVLQHRYSQPGEYTARMNALRNSGETVEQVVLVSATSPPAPARRTLFSVAPSDPLNVRDTDRQWASFTFTADVTGAAEYRFEFGDNEDALVEPAADGTGSTMHTYAGAGSYDATLVATLESGELVTESLPVTVRAPAPAGQVTPEPARIPWWLWLLLGLALTLLVYGTQLLLPVKTGNHLISFEPQAATGQVRIRGSAAANDAVSMRLRRDPGRISLAVNDGE